MKPVILEKSHIEISKNIRYALKNKELTIEECCRLFNNKYKKDIAQGRIQSINKDFISRLMNNKFKIFNSRIALFCDFLNVPTDIKKTNINTLSIEKEINQVATLIEDYPELQINLKELLTNIVAIATKMKEKEGIRK